MIKVILHYAKERNFGTILKIFFWCAHCPIWLPVFFLCFYIEPELGAGIDPGIYSFNPISILHIG